MTVKTKLLFCDVSLLLLWVLSILTVLANLRRTFLLPEVPGLIAVRSVVLGSLGFKSPYGKVSRYPFITVVTLFVGILAIYMILGPDTRDYHLPPGWMRVLVIIMLFCGLMATGAGLYEDMKFSDSKSKEL